MEFLGDGIGTSRGLRIRRSRRNRTLAIRWLSLAIHETANAEGESSRTNAGSRFEVLCKMPSENLTNAQEVNLWARRLSARAFGCDQVHRAGFASLSAHAGVQGSEWPDEPSPPSMGCLGDWALAVGRRFDLRYGAPMSRKNPVVGTRHQPASRWVRIADRRARFASPLAWPGLPRALDRGAWTGWLALWLVGSVAWIGTACGDVSGARDSGEVSGADTETSESPCDPVGDAGCPDDETCSWLPSSAEPVCVSRGPVPPEGLCSTTAACESGVCLSLNASAERCYAMCERDADCGTRGTCLTLSGSPFKVCRIAAVYEACDPLEQGCEPRRDTQRGCYIVASESTPVCLPAGELDVDAECDGPTACRAGYTCDDDVCVPWCDPAVAASCGPLQLCRPLAYAVGVCVPR